MACRTKDLFAAYMIAIFVTTFVLVLSRFPADFSHSVGAYLYGIVFLVLFVVIAISAAIPCAAELCIVKTIERRRMPAFVSGSFLLGRPGIAADFCVFAHSRIGGRA